MRSVWLVAVVGCVGCTGLNPAFFAGSAGDSVGATDPGSGSGASDGSTTRPGTDTTTDGGPTTGASTTATGTVSVGETSTSTGAVSVGETSTSTGESTGVSDTQAASSTTLVPESTGMVDPAICGNKLVEDGEICDEGMNPPLLPGACLPTCDGTIVEKRLIAGGAIQGDFGINGGPMAADEMCNAAAMEFGFNGTFKAVLSDGVNRIAAIKPNVPTGDPEWVLKPFTAYLNADGKIVWVTGKIPLLGVVPNPDPNKPNLTMPLATPITAAMTPVWTGMVGDWTTSKTCDAWTDPTLNGIAGWAQQTTGFLDALAAVQCQKTYGFICAEQ